MRNEEDDLEVAPILPEAIKDDLRWFDFLFAGVVGVAVFALLSIWSFPGLYSPVWKDAAIAASLRPPESVFPGFWYMLVRSLFEIFGIGGGVNVLQVLGRLSLAFSSFLVCLTLLCSMSLFAIKRDESAKRFVIVTRFCSMLGAFFFACADPVWRIGQAFSPESLLLLMTVGALALFASYLNTSKLFCAYLSFLLLGLLSAETPIGFFILASFIALLVFVNRNGIVEEQVLARQNAIKWYLTSYYLLGLIAGIASNCISFISMDGLTALGISTGDLPLLYVTHYWDILISAASIFGWILSLGVVIIPFALTMLMIRRSSDTLYFLPYHVGVLFVITGIISFSQLAWLSPLWYWHWITETAMFNSQYLLAMFIVFSAATVAFTLLEFCIEVFCRNHQSITAAQYEFEGEYEGSGSVPGNLFKAFKFICFCVVPILLIVAVVPGRRLTYLRNILQITNDYVDQIIEECGDVKWIFTDGSFDSHLELRAASKGKKLFALAMMAENSARETYIHVRGIDDKEDRFALSKGPAMLLRTWVRDKPQRYKDFAVQLGFELWKRDGKEIPICAGVLARPMGMPEKERLEYVEKSKALAKRVLDVYKMSSTISKSVGHKIKELFLFTQWRISRIARMRAEVLDRQGQTQLALNDTTLSKELDDNNESFRQILKGMERVRQLTLKQMTPREGLQLALARADFAMARHYAEAIIEVDPENADANFGMGMSYFMQEQWSRAEVYLRRCLIRNPKEPAIYNNLAILQMKMKRFDAAERNAKKALSLIPNSAEVKDTLQQIQKAKAEAMAPKEETKK